MCLPEQPRLMTTNTAGEERQAGLTTSGQHPEQELRRRKNRMKNNTTTTEKEAGACSCWTVELAWAGTRLIIEQDPKDFVEETLLPALRLNKPDIVKRPEANHAKNVVYHLCWQRLHDKWKQFAASSQVTSYSIQQQDKPARITVGHHPHSGQDFDLLYIVSPV